MVPMPYLQERLLPDGTTQPSDFLSGNPALQSKISQISGTESNGNQCYNALQAVLLKRFGGGLEYSVAYTYSKCMTDSSGYYGSWGGQTTPTSPVLAEPLRQEGGVGTVLLRCYACADELRHL